MDSAIKISIIIPIYNAEKYLRQTLRSVLDQSLREIEVICVDDGSTDASPDILREIAGEDSRVKVLPQENANVANARNAGLAVASGEYVHFLDADDYVLNYAYEALYNKMKRYDLDCVKFCAVEYDEPLGTTVKNAEHSLDHLRVGDFNRPIVLDDNNTLLRLGTDSWTGLYRRSFLSDNNIQFDDLAFPCERPFYYRVILSEGRIAASRDRLVVHRTNVSGSLETKAAALYGGYLTALRRIEQQLLDAGLEADVFEKIMQDEFKALLNRCRSLCSNKKHGLDILRTTEEFLARFDYRFLRNIRKEFAKIKDAELRRREQKLPAPTPAANMPVKVFFDECKKPKVSVVVPIFNQEEYLNQALHSLTTQTLADIEFICINDGSTDKSMPIYREYAAIDKRFRLIDKENSGYGHSMNLGIDAARGEYLGILEPDDYVPEHMFKALYDIAAENDLDFIKADFNRFWINENWGTRTKLFRLTSDASYYDRIVNTSEELETFQFVMNTWSGIYKLDFLNRWNIRHNETPGASYQDNGFWFQTFCRGTRVWFLREALYMNRRDNPNSSMFSKGKFYAVTNEYKHIWSWLSSDPKLLAKYQDIFYKKKLANFFVTYYRLDTSLKREYLHHICDEFRGPMEAGKLTEENIGTEYWKALNEILPDPDAYYDRIRVSVVIPAYNVEKYIRPCLDSILVRDEVRMEVIVVDDGSTDGTLAILREYEASDARVRVIAQENGGAGAARNNGMQYATGEYLAFLDADDFYDPEMLRRAYVKAHMDDSDVVVVGSDQYIETLHLYQGASNTIRSDLLPAQRPFAGADIEEDVFKAFIGWPWDKLFRTEFVRENGLFFQEQRTTNDMLFVFSAIVKAERISTLNSVLAHHRRLEAGASLSVSRELSWDCFYKALCAVRQQLKDWDLWERRERDFVNYALHSCLWNVNSLKGSSYYKLYAKLKEEWFEDLGILDKDPLYFYAAGDYEQLQKIMELEAEDYIFYRLNKATDRSSTLESQKKNLNNQLNKAKTDLKKSKKKLANAEKSLKDTKSSTAFRLGTKLLRGPKKLQAIFKR